MDNLEKYELLAEGEVGLPSTMGILPNNTSFSLEFDKIKTLLEAAKDFKLISIDKEGEEIESAEDYAHVEIEYGEEKYELDIYIFSTEGLDMKSYSFGNWVAEQDLEKATQQQRYLETSMHFGDDALTSFHLQLKVMNALISDASLIVDFSSLRLLSAGWLRMTAQSAIPPSPDYLYIIHGVYNDEGGKKEYWLHSHGLHRCRMVEVEMLGISDGAEEMHTLLNMTVKKFLSGVTKEKENFMIGYDGMGINLAWLKWEEAVNDFPKDILGGLKDRQYDNGELDIHAEPSGVLFAVEDGNMISPQIYAKTLADNPIYYITNAETQRMSDLAKERFGTYKETYKKNTVPAEKKGFVGKLFSKKEEKSPWSFLVKLGLTVDDPDVGSDKEHLWFVVKGITDNNEIEGELINQPYWIASLKEGDIKTYPLELLTDWIIYGPQGSYTPDSAYQLEFA